MRSNIDYGNIYKPDIKLSLCDSETVATRLLSQTKSGETATKLPLSYRIAIAKHL